jgi:hypothetical protein
MSMDLHFKIYFLFFVSFRHVCVERALNYINKILSIVIFRHVRVRTHVL